MDMPTSPLSQLADAQLLKTDSLIGGHWVSASARFAVHDPATGTKLAEVAKLGRAEALAAVEADLPHPGVAIEALLPYERGDLLNRIHVSGEVESVEHTGDGSLVRGRVHEGLAGELEPYLVTAERA